MSKYIKFVDPHRKTVAIDKDSIIAIYRQNDDYFRVICKNGVGHDIQWCRGKKLNYDVLAELLQAKEI